MSSTVAKQPESRMRKTLLNAKVNLIFFVLTLALTFFSRKIFLEILGADFVGLTGTLTNLLGYLNLAELGIGAAIGFNLYKPIHDGDRTKINQLVSLFGYYYRNIGLVVLGAAVILSLFFPLIFRDSGFSFAVIYTAFYAFLASALIGYFINYRMVLLTADQRNYVVTGYFQTANIFKVIIQMAVAYHYASYYAWIAIELSFGILYSVILNWKIRQTYPWLSTSVGLGRKQRDSYPNILKSTKQIFVHKIKDFILTQSDQIFIFAFVSLQMVAYYGNYILITSRITSLFSTVTDSIGASVGNLVAENNKQKMLSVFWELMSMRFFIAGFVCFCIFLLIDPFIELWLGSKYLLGTDIVVLILVNLFILISRGTVDNFNHAYGHYGDTWAAWVEGAINITVTLIGGYYLGIVGILLGKTLSLVPIVLIWKPIYLFRDGFRESFWRYFSRYAVLLGVFLLAAVLALVILRLLPVGTTLSWGGWIFYAVSVSSVFGIIYGSLIFFLAPGGRSLLKRLPFIPRK